MKVRPLTTAGLIIIECPVHIGAGTDTFQADDSRLSSSHALIAFGCVRRTAVKNDGSPFEHDVPDQTAYEISLRKSCSATPSGMKQSPPQAAIIYVSARQHGNYRSLTGHKETSSTSPAFKCVTGYPRDFRRY
ncbi:hypothetical protein CEXT_521831 [Caerostris extrusa]|uniref:FHA domain-containing protein n=1 Tax=Caerostris extrusa TaxID=172846 RepID=A0AAV4Y0S6_CAEEX|nr:hypothetical protein CEXT_521831 [Caerostris extrusa]